ncbi:MAG: SRPBCC family protein [Acidobacteria bacterium]|nr:SRPBCC family protein [Acidobacteriota bacterium]MBV9071733.1 SRPBCC family protein [Acidobacteriota bacterium]MBV9188270.1 SRPBCC family protein [Acidobacteriota bacterium]
MTTITIVTKIRASPERCFDASRDLDLHIESMGHTGERAVAGRTSGLIELGEQVTWEGRHFGVRQRFTSAITAYDRPRHFQDSMVRGAFQSFVHDHYFEPCDEGTRMMDVLAFRSPFGVLGAIVDRLIMTAYLTRMLTKRNEIVKAVLEREPFIRR